MSDAKEKNGRRPGEDEVPPTASFSNSVPGPGGQIGPFRIERELGRGAVGVVYLAHDTKLDRSVAIKSLPAEVMANPKARSRFAREARLLASLNHPNIATIYEEIKDAEGVGYLVLEYVPGQTLAERIAKKPLKLEEALTIALQIAEAVAAAHEHDVIHRDLKPGNIKITPEGKVKVLDFGLAKAVGGEALDQQSTITEPGRVIGTPAYMSPEQARGKPADKRSDIWSFGCVLYEMLTATAPFKGETTSDTLANILQTDPDWQALPIEADRNLRRIVEKCLRKDLEQRYQSASELCHDLMNYQKTLTAPSPKAVNLKALVRLLRKPQVAGFTLFVLVSLCIGAFWFFGRRAEVRWARLEAIPEIMRLIEQEKYFDAFSLALKAEQHLPKDPVLTKLWPRMSQNYSVTTEPAGASIFYREYANTEGDWLFLGYTPLKDVRFPPGFYAWKVTKDGYETIEAARLVNRATWMGGADFQLCEKGAIPPEMVFIPATNTSMGMLGFHTRQQIALEAFLIDRFEVTNKEYKEFVDNGGYKKREYWEHDFVKDGHKLTWEEAIGEFCDVTGWPGPFLWRYGNPPKGQGECPVGGISWYEAAAYAKYRGKELPTVYHWCRAAMATLTGPSITSKSNFGSEGPIIVGSMQGLGFYGTYDMAGNVREWCYNAADDSSNHRYILGGAWGEVSYMYGMPVSRSGFDRYLKNGFRCMKYLDEENISEERRKFLTDTKNLVQRDLSKAKPISDDKFDLLRTSHFSYDHNIPFDVEVQSYENVSDKWRKEKVTINAAYGGERMGIYIFTPKNKNVVPPYQAVIGFPGLASLQQRSSEGRKPDEYIIESGRAVVLPNYKGMFERGPLPYEINLAELPIFEWVKDWLRTIDYLETREDIDVNRLAYLGGSLGGSMGSYISGPKEPRFKAGIFVLAGIPIWEDFVKPRPEYDPVNYLPRITIPVLMINGRYDTIFPVETSQKPMFELLGTPEEDKYHIIVSDGQHGGWDPQKTDGKIVQFLDKYLGSPFSK